jgi:hypothetical protein
MAMIPVFRRACACLALGLALAGTARGQVLAKPPTPVLTPAQDTGFVGSISVTIDDDKSGDGKVYYTLNGDDPALLSAKTTLYTGPIKIQATTTLRAVRVAGTRRSYVAVGVYTQRRLPMPAARFGGKAEFEQTVTCTLTVQAPAVIGEIRFTLDGSAPESGGKYDKPIPIGASAVLRAVAMNGDYATSPELNVPFTKMEKAKPPKATPDSGVFSNPHQVVVLSSGSPGALFRYTFDRQAAAGNWQWTKDTVLMEGKNAGDTLVLTAVATENHMTPSDPIVRRYVYLPRPPMPAPSRPPGDFFDVARFTLQSTPGAIFHCTFDGKVPDADSPVCGDTLNIDSTVTVKAIAVKSPQPPSQVFSGTYTLKLSPPNSSRFTSSFHEPSITVFLTSPAPKADIVFTLDGSDPTVNHGSHYGRNNPGVDLSSTTTLKAIAYKSGVTSPIATFVYTYSDTVAPIPGPVMIPAGPEFLDSLLVELRTEDNAAQIYYTLDDSKPGIDAQHLYTRGKPILIYQSTTIKAIAYLQDQPVSDVSEARYTLIPSPPIIDPRPGTYANRVDVSFTTRTRGAYVHYWYGDKPYDPLLSEVFHLGQTPIILTASAKIRAVTVLDAEHVVSAPIVAQFDIYHFYENDTLNAGDSRTVDGGYRFTNRSTSSVMARIIGTDAEAITGFEKTSLGLQLSALPGASFPKINYARDSGRAEALYRLGSDNRVELITGGDSTVISKPGLYFPGTDIQPPKIRIASQELHFGQATQVRISVEDNVAGASCRVESPAFKDGVLFPAPDADGKYTVTLKNDGSNPASLDFRAKAADYRNTSWFPSQSGWFSVSQALASVTTPAILQVGMYDGWDLIGLPLDSSSHMTLGRLKTDNPGKTLAAATFNGTDPVLLKDSDPIPPGGLWVGSTQPTSSLTFTNFLSGPSDSDGQFRMRVRPGWNLVANPAWQKLYWPISRKFPRYTGSKVKSLFYRIPASNDYGKSDSLELWKGYFVYSFLNQDTLLTLLTAPPAPPLARLAVRPPHLEMTFGRDERLPLLLGALPDAEDGIAVEDEPQLPTTWGSERFWLQRGRHRLISDWVKFDPQTVCRWELVSDPGNRPGVRSGPSPLRMLENDLPPGFEAWALSLGRRIKIRLQEGMELPIGDAGSADTLIIFAGPAAKLAALDDLNRAAERIDAVAWTLAQGRGGLVLSVTVPQGARIQADLWSPTGRRLAGFVSGRLGAGVHDFPLDRKKEIGLGLLRLSVSGAKTPGGSASGEAVFTRKVLLR